MCESIENVVIGFRHPSVCYVSCRLASYARPLNVPKCLGKTTELLGESVRKNPVSCDSSRV